MREDFSMERSMELGRLGSRMEPFIRGIGKMMLRVEWLFISLRLDLVLLASGIKRRRVLLIEESFWLKIKNINFIL